MLNFGIHYRKLRVYKEPMLWQ